PPLLERIRALDPSFDLRSLRALESAASAASSALAADGETIGSALAGSSGPRAPLDAHERAAQAGGETRAVRAAPGAGAPADGAGVDPADPGSPLARAGEMGSPELGAALRAALPLEIYDSAHSRDPSRPPLPALGLR